VVFADVDADPATVLDAVPGVSTIADSRDFSDGKLDLGQTAQADVTVFGELGMAVMTAEPAQIRGLGSHGNSGDPILSISPELVHHMLPMGDASYIEGYRDGIADLSRRLVGAAGGGGGLLADPVPPFVDSAQFTWGLQATRAGTSPRSGRGVKVAVLDTGLDLAHPDFAGRSVTAQSFVPGETAQDGHGHGTHCVGTACGPKSPISGPRYAVAYEADIFVGKVLSNAGSGTDAGILAGINWAVGSGCAVVSMSLGADVPQVHPPYTTAGRRALDKGVLLVAAAGNNADRREGRPGFVGPPGSSPYIMAIAAVDQRLDPAWFSARSLLATRGGQVDLAGPGVEVLSAWPMPTRYRSISGTSMATPHVAGVAALWSEQTGYRGRDLWALLAMESERLEAASLDVGGGLVLAPQ
jgi:subtilisin family serine protease